MRSYIVDAFTNEPFKGNPAGVCFPPSDLEPSMMLKIAQEFGLSETAFVRKTKSADTYTIRYFSPKQEIPLCGHATLASAKVLFNETDTDEIVFSTVENLTLTIRRKGKEIAMEFPAYDVTSHTVPEATLKALGLERIVKASYSPANKIVLLEIERSEVLAALTPDFHALLHSHQDINGVLVTAPSSDEYDYHYRYFWPWAGTNEDPVTGGVQTFLAKYWAQKLNKTKMKAFQSSQRTGFMTVELSNDKILIYGVAQIMLAGDLMV
jgi:PhzF family phenazine biosynthesis protein